MYQLIAVNGPAGSGKSHAANILVEEFGYTRMKFAAPLKAMMHTLLGFAGVPEREYTRYSEGDLKETPVPVLGGKSARHVMVTLGTEWGRELIHPDIWVNLALQPVLELLASGQGVVVDDCRFDNEAFEIKKLGGIVAQIRPTWPEWPEQQAERRRAQGPAGFHISEAGLRRGLVTHLIPNCGEATGFRREIVEVLGL
jgi:hypothetical protein